VRHIVWILLLGLAACSSPEQAKFEPLTSPSGLEELGKSFAQRVEKVHEGLYVAIGFGLANTIMIEGESGLIIVDTLESEDAAKQALAAFRQISDKPVSAIIYTHNHADHVFGAGVFAEGRDIPVYAHETTSYYIDRILNQLRPIISRRSMRMFGNLLDDEDAVNDGIGKKLKIDMDSNFALLRPTQTFRDTLDLEIEGVKLELVFAPGETNDQLFVWLPKTKTLLSGDNIYKTFPNLYTIRGTPYRDVTKWVASLDMMRARKPEFLVPSHTNTVTGRDEIYRVLTDYRDAIQYVHDQTIRLMNDGLTPDELVEQIQLPPHLAGSPYLAEYYGTVAWSVRSIYDGNLGWFDGNPSNLFPLSPLERAKKHAAMAGGTDKLLALAEKALADKEYQWALELTDHLLLLDGINKRVRAARVTALTRLGELEGNPNARHYYLTSAAELGQGLQIKRMGKTPKQMVHGFPTESFFRFLAVSLDPVASADVNTKVGFHFPDTKEDISIHVRRGVAEVQIGPADDLDIKVTVNAAIFKEMSAGMRNKAITLAKDFKIEGGTFDLIGFFRLFNPPNE